MKHRTDKEYQDIDMKTALQWAKEGKLPNVEAEGESLWCNPWHQKCSVYYRAEEVHEADKKELEQFFKPYRERKRERRKRAKEQEKWLWEQELKDSYERGAEETRIYYEKQLFNLKCNLKQNIYSAVTKQEQGKRNFSKHQGDGVICFDVETTGLDPTTDEILQISVINGKGEELINTYVKPYYTQEWKSAAVVNQITREMIENAPYAHELMAELKEIFSSADTWITYNGSFDQKFLEYLGIEAAENVQTIDVMYDFALLYGEWSNHYECYKWQSLSTCAGYFGYEFKAHDSLEDVKATLYCYNCIKKMMKNGTYQEIVSQNQKNMQY